MSVANAEQPHQRQMLSNFDVKHCEQFAAHNSTEINKSAMHLHQLSSDDITTTTSVASKQQLSQISCGGAPRSPPSSQHHHHQPTTIDNTSSLNQHCRLLEEEVQYLKAERLRLTQECSDAQRREKTLMRRLANKEQEFQDYVSQIAEYKAAQAPGASAIRSTLLDPAINLLFEKLKKELQATKAKLEETQNELAAWKFTPDSNTGKRLMAKCRLLYQENEELGKMTSNGRLSKLETELAMQKSFSDEVKKSQSELDDFLQELDEDVEGMQSTILFLQQELKTTRDRIQLLERENHQLKNGTIEDEDSQLVACSSHSQINGKNSILETGNEGKIPVSKVESNKNLSSNVQHLTDEKSNNKYLSNHSCQLSTVAKELDSIDEKSISRTTISNCVFGSTSVNPDTSEINGGDSTVKKTVIEDDDSNNGFGADISGVGGNKILLTNSRKRQYESDSSDSGSAAVTSKISRSAGVNATTKRGRKKQTIDRLSSVRSSNEEDISEECLTDVAGGVVVVANLPPEPSDIGGDGEKITDAGSALQAVAVATTSSTVGGNSRVLARKKSLRNSFQNGESNL